MKLSELKKTHEKIEINATTGRPGYAYDPEFDCYQIWDGNRWNGTKKPNDNGELEDFDPWKSCLI